MLLLLKDFLLHATFVVLDCARLDSRFVNILNQMWE